MPSLLSLQTPDETAKSLADRAKALRLANAWTRTTLASRAGISEASLKRFESTGSASLELVLKVAFALARLEDFSPVFRPPQVTTLAELLASDDRPVRKRGRL